MADVLASGAQSLDEVVEVVDEDAGVGLGGGPEVVLDAHVQLNAARTEPCTASSGKYRRLVDLGHPKDTTEERSRGPLLTSAHGQLHVV